DEFLVLDGATQRNLELTRNNYDGSRTHTLLSILDGAQTPMGSRMINKWLVKPLVNRAAIEERQQVVAWSADQIVWKKTVASLLSHVGDLERTVGRIALSRATLPDYLLLRNSLAMIPLLGAQLIGLVEQMPLIKNIIMQLTDFSALRQLLES